MEFVQDVAGGCLYVAIIIAVVVVIEHISVIERFSLRSRFPGFLMNLVQVPLMIVAAWPAWWLWDKIAIDTGITVPLAKWLAPFGTFGLVAQTCILVLFADFLAYWCHRAEHAFFWSIHSVHHAPTELHAANSIAHPLQMWYTIVCIGIPMRLIDSPAVSGIITFVAVLLTYYIHSPIDVHFGPLRKVLVDNRFHRIHHSVEPRHFDKNFGIGFSLWDRMFGSAYDPAPDEWPVVGLAGGRPPRTVGDYLLTPFRRAQTDGTVPADSAAGSAGPAPSSSPGIAEA